MGTLRFVYDNKNNEVSLLSKHYSKDFQNHGLQAIAASVVIFYADKPDAGNTLPWTQEHQRDIPASLSMIPAPVMMGMPGPHAHSLEQGLCLGPRGAPQDGCSFQGGYPEGVPGHHSGPGMFHHQRRAGRRRASDRDSTQETCITASPSSSVEVVDADASMPESSAPPPGVPHTHLINGTGGAMENYSHPGLHLHTEGDGGAPRPRGASMEYSRGPEAVMPGHPEPCIRTDGFVMQLQPSSAPNSGVCEGDARTSGSHSHPDGFSAAVNSGMEQGEGAQDSVESSSASLVGSHGAGDRQGPEALQGHASISTDRSASSVAAPVHVEENGSRHQDLGEGSVTQACSDASATGCAAPPSSTMTTASSGGEPQMCAMPGPAVDRSLDINAATSSSRVDMDRHPATVFPLREVMGPGVSNSFSAQDPGRGVHLDNMMQIDLTEIKVEPVDHDMLVDAHMMPPGPSSSRRRTFHGYGFPPEAMLGARNSTGSLDVELFAAHPAGAGVFRMPGPMGRSLPSGQGLLQRKPSKAGKDSPKHMARSRRSAQCALCSAGIFSLMDFLRHLHLHRELLEHSSSFSCPVCLKSSQSYAEVARVHVATHIDKDSHTCPVCGVHITRKDALKRHFLLLHPNHMSEFANYSLQLAGLMSEAWRKLAPKAQPAAPATPSRQMLNQSTTCSFCQLTIDSKDDFMTHVEMHACLSPEFRCPICLQVFSTRCHLTRHAACHLSKEWACPLCFQTFARSDSYNRHMRNMHKKPDPDPAPAASTDPVPS